MTGYCRRCRKRAYLSEAHALNVAEHVHATRNVILRAYLCPRRHGWHLTKRT